MPDKHQRLDTLLAEPFDKHARLGTLLDRPPHPASSMPTGQTGPQRPYAMPTGQAGPQRPYAMLTGRGEPPRERHPIINELSRGHHMARQAHHMLMAIGSPKQLPDFAEDIVASRRAMREIPVGPGMQRFQQSKSIIEALGVAAKNPIDVAAPLVAGSIAPYLEVIAPATLGGAALGGLAGAMIGSGAGPVGVATGLNIGARAGASVGAGTGSLLVEASSEYFDEMEQAIIDRGGDVNDPDWWRDVLQDEVLVSKARASALKKGIPIAVLDAISVGVAGRLVAATKGAVKRTIAATGEVAIQSALGATGEAAGQFVQKGEITDPSAIAAEAIAELGPGSVEVAGGAALQSRVKTEPPAARAGGQGPEPVAVRPPAEPVIAKPKEPTDAQETEAKAPTEAPAPGVLSIHDDGFDLPSENVWQFLKRKAIDSFAPLQRTQKAVVEAGGTISDETNAFLQQELISGKVRRRLDIAKNVSVKPLVRAINRGKLTTEQVDDYLYARHAPARNARIAEINPKLAAKGVPGSGMSNEESATILANFSKKGLTPKLEKIARHVDRITRQTRKILVEGGLISQAQADEWVATQGPHYVPLRSDIENQGARVGKGLDIRGPESKAALGRRSKADSPLVFLLQAHDAAIIRAEKNKVGQSLLQFLRDNKAKHLWKIGPGRKPQISKETGLVEFAADPTHKLKDNVLSVKVDGRETLIEFRGNAQLIARAMKNMGAEHSSAVVRALSPIMRVLSALSTSYNPEFILTNLTRDLQTAGFNITADKGVKLAAKIVNPVRLAKVLKGIVDAQRGKRGGKWAEHYADFLIDGGKVGWFHAQTFGERAGELEASLKDVNPSKTRRVAKALQGVAHLIEQANSAVENVARLSAYMAMREQGASRRQAASFARNLTVNFNRKGELGPLVNSLYLFANASIQGTARIFQAMKSPMGRKIAMALIVEAFMQDMMNRMLAGEDDDGRNHYDKIPDHIKERNLIIMLPGTEGRYAKVPLPYGYSVLHVFGQQAAQATFDNEHSVGDAFGNVFSSLLGSFSPIGSEKSAIQLLTPTLLDPIVQIETNETFYGSPITPEQAPYGPPAPRSELYWRSTSKTSVDAARALNRWTGGTDVEPGFVDLHPGWFDHVGRFLTGGAGATVGRTADTFRRIVSGDELPLNNIPFARRFAGEPDERVVGADYWDRVQSLKVAESAIKQYQESGRHKDARRISAKMGAVWAHRESFEEMSKDISDLSRQLRATEDKAKRERLIDQRIALQKRYLRAWRRRGGGK